MLHRPLIPFFVAFAGGIFAVHILSEHISQLLPILCVAVVVFLICIVFASGRFKIACLLIAFFLFGGVLDQTRHTTSRLLSRARQQKVVLEGVVLGPPQKLQKTSRIDVRVLHLFWNEEAVPTDEKVRVTIYNHAPKLAPGDLIRFPAKVRAFKNFNNPGKYDYKAAMAVRNFTCAASVSDGRYIVSMGPGPMPVHRRLTLCIQEPVRRFFRQHLSPENHALYSAMILGDRRNVKSTFREPFNCTGLGHVLAVSGLHVGLVAWAAFWFFRWLLSRPYSLPLKMDIRKPTAMLTCLPVCGYVFLAGFQIPAQRAMIMVLVFLLSFLLDREKEFWSTLCLAGLIILAIDPFALFSMSFQLSFSAVMGILWLTPPIMRRLSLPAKKDKRHFFVCIYNYIIGLAAVCLAATLFLLPLTVTFFHRIPLVAVPANIMAVPLLGLWVIPLGLLSVVVLPLSTAAAGWLLQMGAWGLNIMMAIIRFWADFSWSSIWMVTPNLFETALFYGALFFGFYYKGRRWAKAGLLAVVVLALIDTGYWLKQVRFNDTLRVTFLDVGQANAALVAFPHGEKMMIDGGGFPGGRFNVGRMVVAPFLWHSKILKIDYLVMSHPQSDHMNGLRFIAENFHAKEFWCNGDQVETASYKELMRIIQEKNIKTLLPMDLAGGRRIHGAFVEILHPDPQNPLPMGAANSRRLNNNSLVLRISYDGMRFLFPGDLEQAGESALLAKAGDRIQCNVLLSPHHGSGNSSTPDFLQKTRPRVCVISCGANNFFGFPHPRTLQRLADAGCYVIRIDQTGAACFTVDQNGLSWKTFLKGRTEECPPEKWRVKGLRDKGGGLSGTSES